MRFPITYQNSFYAEFLQKKLKSTNVEEEAVNPVPYFVEPNQVMDINPSPPSKNHEQAIIKILGEDFHMYESPADRQKKENAIV